MKSAFLLRVLGKLLGALWREYRADWRRKPLLRPAFKSQGRDFKASLCVLAAVCPFWLLAGWKGYLLPEVVITGFGLVFLVPVALLATALLWKSIWRPAQRFNRFALQVVFVVALTIPLDAASFVVDRISEATCLRRGREVSAAVDDYAFRHGRLPASLAEVEKEQGHPLPRPTFGDRFGYAASSDGHTFTLGFSGSGLSDVWFWNSASRQWTLSECD